MILNPQIIPPPGSNLIQREISGGERKVFRELRDIKGYDEWFAIHSLLLPEHQYKTVAEIDFVLVGPPGIFCLEVKGTKVRLLENGIWDYDYKKTNEGPFNQAKTAMFTLKKRLADNFRFDFNLSDICFGFGVIFTENEFRIKSTEWDLEIILDIMHMINDPDFMLKYLRRLERYWSKKEKGLKLDEYKREQIMQALRPDFEVAKMLRNSVEVTDENFTWLTKSQYKALDLSFINQHILFEGGAGTGKTFIALESARRHLMKGQTVLFLCFNPILAKFLQDKICDSNILITSVHEFFVNSLVKKKNFIPVPGTELANSPLYTISLPEEFIDQVEKREDFKRFDVLIVDEAQDLISYRYLMALDLCIKGGLTEGIWRIYLDSKNQKGLQGVFEKDAYEELMKMNPTVLTLTDNCRNTRQVILNTKIFTGLDFSSDSGIDGITRKFYFDDTRDLQIKLTALITELLRDYQPGDITILTYINFGTEAWQKKLINDFKIQLISRNSVVNFPFNRITISDPLNFKGLENRFIIYLPVESITEADRFRFYVAFTRARYGLYVFIKKNLENEINNIILNNYAQILR